MTILASRKYTCSHPMAPSSRNIDEDCKTLREKKARGASGGCPHEARAFATSAALPTAWDIEELGRVSKRVGGCGYYASRGDYQQKACVGNRCHGACLSPQCDPTNSWV